MPNDSTLLSNYEYYEPLYFAFSPTYKSWVKLFIHDCYNLRSLEGFEGTRARFWKNHPIRWIQLVGIVIGVNIRAAFAELEIDDGSGSNINVNVRGEVGDSINLDTERNQCSVDVGQLIRVKGTLATDHKLELQLVADKIDIIRDPLFELSAWKERVHLRETVLDVPWHCDIDSPSRTLGERHERAAIGGATSRVVHGRRNNLQLAEHAKMKEDVKRQAVMDLHLLPDHQHTQRNLKLVFLHYLQNNGLKNFTIAQLRTAKELERAVICVTQKRLRTYRDTSEMHSRYDADLQRVSSSQKYRTINACLAELVRDGSILSMDIEQGTYSVVGVWNLGLRMQELMQEMFAADSHKIEVTTREMWQAVRASGRGFESVSKQIVQKVLSEMQADSQTDTAAQKEDYNP
ncbi:Predicted protein [Taphrina deformans PYCC 5710]|uniref:CST complex subunit Stn1 N-terminal domain-containing protein n=1 Tax=Taphrina deformans (strain PYCC 5710 / ATCC 11124 / CBS 356.35 / IMI 108563 / JCM 9778 / NBRC 8474) TaxID=1097556 RepID=R4XH13_TAPDE|nr:Predicted protein [Taphrina deformans PYCC 5710]|eukprot:CCG82661.1 Predicted protein [Taphrina deformans PYCC 5710]